MFVLVCVTKEHRCRNLWREATETSFASVVEYVYSILPQYYAIFSSDISQLFFTNAHKRFM